MKSLWPIVWCLTITASATPGVREANEMRGECKSEASSPVGIFDGRYLCRNVSKHRLDAIRYDLIQVGTHFDFSSAIELSHELTAVSKVSIREDSAQPNLIIIFASTGKKIDVSESIGKFLIKSGDQDKEVNSLQKDTAKFQDALSDPSIDSTGMSTTIILKGKSNEDIYVSVVIQRDPSNSFWTGGDILNRFMEALGISFGALKREG